MVDRLKASLFALFRSAVPRLDYYAKYDAQVVKWNRNDQTADVVPSDAKVPSMSSIPFKHGAAGETLDVTPGTRVLVGWENGDPARPFAATWSGGEHVVKRVMNADEIILGGETGAEPAVLGDVLRAILVKVENHIHVCTGGTVSPSVMLTGLEDPRASNVRVK